MAEGYEHNTEASPEVASPKVRMKLLVQMTEAIENELDSYCRRAAAFEEEEVLLSRQIHEQEMEVNRLRLKLESLRCEREALFQRTESLRTEAAAMKEEAYNNEDEIALSLIYVPSVDGKQTAEGGPVFFKRMTVKSETVT